MQLTFERGPEFSRERREMPADLYNRQHLLWVHAHAASLFVPIRSMQYLAVIDREEIIFVDGLRPRLVMVSWQRFGAHERERLTTPVPYDCVLYEEDVVAVDKRLHQAFFLAVEALEKRQPRPDGTAPVVPIRGPDTAPSE